MAKIRPGILTLNEEDVNACSINTIGELEIPKNLFVFLKERGENPPDIIVNCVKDCIRRYK